MPQESNLILATKGLLLFGDALFKATDGLEDCPYGSTAEEAALDMLPDCLPIDDLLENAYYRRVLKEHGFYKGASKQEKQEWEYAATWAMGTFSAFAVRLAYSKFPEEFYENEDDRREHSWLGVFLDKAKNCTPEEYKAWAQKMADGILENFGVADDDTQEDEQEKN